MVKAHPFDPATLRASLAPLAFDAESASEHDSYLAHYGLDFHKRSHGMRHHLGVVKTERHDVCVHLWHPADAVGSAVVIHGYYDHTGLYGHLIGHLLGRKLAVLSFDLPGHGLSSGSPATIETFEHYLDAFNETLAATTSQLPKPWHLVGQSTGAAVAMEWLLANRFTKANVPFDSIVLLAPLVRPYAWAPFNRIVYEVARRWITERPRTFVTNADNAEFIEFLRDRDPLQARILPVQWVTAMQNWRRRFERYPPLGSRAAGHSGTCGQDCRSQVQHQGDSAVVPAACRLPRRRASSPRQRIACNSRSIVRSDRRRDRLVACSSQRRSGCAMDRGAAQGVETALRSNEE